jgi:hypothetical protein
MNPAENWHTAAEPVAPPMTAPPPMAVPAVAVPAPLGRKNPILAALLSAFPGMGNIYNGLYVRGITFFVIVISLGVLADSVHDLFGFAVAFFWLFNVIDAYRQATLINYGYAQDLGLVDLPLRPRASQGGVLAGILLTGIGIVAICDQYLNIRMEWILELWPFALVLAGIWLIWASMRDRRRANEAREGL